VNASVGKKFHGIVQQDVGLTFAAGLRSILRQDPDVVMVGEIRDAETAGVAVNTALTGHLLLSTLHTTDAVTAVPRLIDMGIEPYLIASTLELVIGQRLVRCICNECKEEYVPPSEALARLSEVLSDTSIDRHWYRGRGCTACKGTG